MVRSYVVSTARGAEPEPLLIAGGGGGSAQLASVDRTRATDGGAGRAGESGGSSTNAAGGQDGHGGHAQDMCSPGNLDRDTNSGSAGAGFLSDGYDGETHRCVGSPGSQCQHLDNEAVNPATGHTSLPPFGGRSFANGLEGGEGDPCAEAGGNHAHGGFGGGGGGCISSGGGGGGYSGGGSCGTVWPGDVVGGGGGSFNSGTDQVMTTGGASGAASNYDGVVTITLLGN